MKLLRYFTAGLPLAVLLMQGCANEDVVAESHNSVQFVISAPYASTSTRAVTVNEGAYVDKATPAELMKKYAVAVTLPGSNKIVAFAKKDGFTTGVESDVVDMELRAGQYKVYGFANIDSTALAALGIKEGGTIPPDLDKLRTFMPGLSTDADKPFQGPTLVPASMLGTTEDFPAIPMTSIAGQDVTVTERVNQTFGIEVRRMMAKLQFDFRNPTPNDVYVHGISVGDMTLNKFTAPESPGTPEKPFLLMNPEEDRTPVGDDLTKVFPADLQKATLTHNYGSAPLKLDKDYDYAHCKLSSGLFNPDVAPSGSAVFYVLESAAHTDGVNANTFQLDFNMTNTSDGSSPLGDNMRYALTTADDTKPGAFTLIHRNDWIVIPITIGEWVMDLTAFSYPPIGGYPDAKVASDGENVFHVKFSAPGDIAFYPTIHKYYSAADFFYLNDPNRIKSGTTSITVDDPSHIFSIAPSVLGSAGEYTATLSGTKGKATITVKTTFYPNYPDKSVEKPFTAIIYVEKV